MINKSFIFYSLLIFIFIFYNPYEIKNKNNYKITTYNLFWAINNISILPSYLIHDIQNNIFYKDLTEKIDLLSEELLLLDSDIFFFQEVYDINFINDLNKKLNYNYIPLIQNYNLSKTEKLPLHTACLYKKNLDINIVDNHFTNNFGRLLHVYDKVNNLNFINIHLISSIENYEKRLKQLGNIIDYIKDLDNVILLGDFNDFDSNYYYVTNNTINNNLTALDILNKNNFINSYKFYENKNIYTQYLNKKYKFLDLHDLQTLDYIFFKNDFSFYNVNVTLLNDLEFNDLVHNKWISDHRSVTVYFEF
jgi:hypothetical protein